LGGGLEGDGAWENVQAGGRSCATEAEDWQQGRGDRKNDATGDRGGRIEAGGTSAKWVKEREREEKDSGARRERETACGVGKEWPTEGMLHDGGQGEGGDVD